MDNEHLVPCRCSDTNDCPSKGEKGECKANPQGFCGYQVFDKKEEVKQVPVVKPIVKDYFDRK